MSKIPKFAEEEVREAVSRVASALYVPQSVRRTTPDASVVHGKPRQQKHVANAKGENERNDE